MTANSTNSFLEAWSALVEAVRNGVVKHVSKLCHLYPSISFKVMVIGVLLAYLGTADNRKQRRLSSPSGGGCGGGSPCISTQQLHGLIHVSRAHPR